MSLYALPALDRPHPDYWTGLMLTSLAVRFLDLIKPFTYALLAALKSQLT